MMSLNDEIPWPSILRILVVTKETKIIQNYLKSETTETIFFYDVFPRQMLF